MESGIDMRTTSMRKGVGPVRVGATTLLATVGLLLTMLVTPPSAGAANPSGYGGGGELQHALDAIVTRPDGPPGIIVTVQRGSWRTTYTAGTSTVGRSDPIRPTDHLRLASVSKAYSGAASLSLVADHLLSLDDTVGKWLPALPKKWHPVTLAELLQHTSGIQDFSDSKKFIAALLADPLNPPPPTTLLSYAKHKLRFVPGTDYHYSNSDNIIVALMVQAASGQSYQSELASRVFGPLGLSQTSLPQGAAIPMPYVHGYGLDPPNAPIDVSEQFAAGWSGASGGMVATPADTNTFIRGYARGATTSPAVHAAQFTFRPGSSEPPGPGTNSAGLAIFRYQTSCGTLYGHTGNTSGYTNFAAATADGSRSVVVQINAQITPKVNGAAFPDLLHIDELGACAALGR